MTSPVSGPPPHQPIRFAGDVERARSMMWRLLIVAGIAAVVGIGVAIAWQTAQGQPPLDGPPRNPRGFHAGSAFPWFFEGILLLICVGALYMAVSARRTYRRLRRGSGPRTPGARPR